MTSVKTALAGLAVIVTLAGSAHAELIIQEKDPSASIINRYEVLKDADYTSLELHQLVDDLNQRVANNPKDTLAWEILAQIYYSNGYDLYALYAASEAIDQGYSTNTLEKILLDSSMAVSQSQLQSGYLGEEVDQSFVTEYQYALSKIYGEVYDFNYDESLPKPPPPVLRKRTSPTRAHKAPRRATRPAIKTPVRVTPPRTRRVEPPKPRARPVRRPTPARQPTRRAPPKPVARPNDPFGILR